MFAGPCHRRRQNEDLVLALVFGRPGAEAVRKRAVEAEQFGQVGGQVGGVSIETSGRNLVVVPFPRGRVVRLAVVSCSASYQGVSMIRSDALNHATLLESPHLHLLAVITGLRLNSFSSPTTGWHDVFRRRRCRALRTAPPGNLHRRRSLRDWLSSPRPHPVKLPLQASHHRHPRCGRRPAVLLRRLRGG